MAGSGKAVVKYLKQDFSALKSQYMAQQELFSDPTFPAVVESLGYDKFGPNSYKVNGVEWKRPKEITSNPQFIVEGATRTDICQGKLGDCWLMAAIASLTLDQDILAHVIHPEQNFTDDYTGIFHFKLWQFGQWMDVVVDDFLPCKNGELLFVHSEEKNEFWSALLEKAYAKVNGCYEALVGGSATEGFEDFTGGIAERYELNKAPPNLFGTIKKALSHGSLLSSAISPRNTNENEVKTKERLVKTHAYSITGAEEVHVGEGLVELVRLRNPWGHLEWTGAWSDDSKEWDHVLPEEKAKLDHSRNDGEFWMAYSDFMQQYTKLEICNLTPDSLSSAKEGHWDLRQFEGSWTLGSTADGCRDHPDTFSSNPQYVITLGSDSEQDCSAVVALMQKGGRQERQLGQGYDTIGFYIYKVPDKLCMCKGKANCHLGTDDLEQLDLVTKCGFTNSREVRVRVSLPAGQYVIIPSTYEPNHERSFLLRVFQEKPLHPSNSKAPREVELR
ncbi:calpain-2 catalytic subunit-like [Brachyhypopomus gauderio]|uniref:calpain-2 catalytic subunit-like n=1 Tax=Brachyhypopomus gauderio TaxID=698409 RepID=UPI004041CBEB